MGSEVLSSHRICRPVLPHSGQKKESSFSFSEHTIKCNLQLRHLILYRNVIGFVSFFCLRNVLFPLQAPDDPEFLPLFASIKDETPRSIPQLGDIVAGPKIDEGHFGKSIRGSVKFHERLASSSGPQRTDQMAGGRDHHRKDMNVPAGLIR